MATKKQKPASDREVIVANSAKLREIAALIHECAAAYEKQAELMDQHSVETIEYKGFVTIRDRVVKLLRGNAISVAGSVLAKIDASRMLLIAENSENYVESEAPNPNPKRKSSS